jgi:hypothetical protein
VLYTELHDAYIAAYNVMMAARAQGTRSETQTMMRNSTRRALIAYARELYGMVQANNSVSDADKVLLGIHVRDNSKSKINAPTERPGVDVLSVVGRTVTVLIYDSASIGKRGKPRGAVSAWVYTHAGPDFPSDPSRWQFRGAFNRPKARIVFPDSVANGEQVWIRAAWVSRRGETGPVSEPITTNIQGGGTSAATKTIRAAA